MLTSSSTESKEYFPGAFSPRSTTSQPSSLLTTIQLESSSLKFPEIRGGKVDVNENDANNVLDLRDNLQFLGTIGGNMTNPLGMTLKPPPSESTGSGDASKQRGSRLDQIQAQFRQKLESEKELKMRDIFDKSRRDADRRIERITGGVGAIDPKPSPIVLRDAAVDANSVASGGLMKEFFVERRRIEMNGGRDATGLPNIQTHLKQKRNEFQKHQQQRQEQVRTDQHYHNQRALKPPQHPVRKGQMTSTKNKPLSPIAPDHRLNNIGSNNNNNDNDNNNDENGDRDGFNSTYSLASSTLHPARLPRSPEAVTPKREIVAPASVQKSPLLPPVKTKKGRSPTKEASPRMEKAVENPQQAFTGDAIPSKMAPIKKAAGNRRRNGAKAPMEAENMKFLDKILEAERRRSAHRRRTNGNNGQRSTDGDPDANQAISKREDEIMMQINQKMAELDQLRSQNKNLGDRSRGSSRIGQRPMDDEDARRDAASDSPSIPDADQAKDYRFQNDDDDDENQIETLRTKMAKTPPTSSSRRRRIASREISPPPPPSSSTTTTVRRSPPAAAAVAAGAATTSSSSSVPSVDAWRSKPRINHDEENERREVNSTRSLLGEAPEDGNDAAAAASYRRNGPRAMKVEEDDNPRYNDANDNVRDEAPSSFSDHHYDHGRSAPLAGGGSGVAVGSGGGGGGLEEGAVADVRTVPCRNCGRRFAEERVDKHETACTGLKARKKFDSKKNRVDGQDHAAYALDQKYQQERPKKESNWRAKREEFVRNLRYARVAGKDAPPPPATVNPDYVQCPHCDRRFNEYAAERHIPKCKDLKTKSVGQRAPVGNSTKTISKPPSNTRRR